MRQGVLMLVDLLGSFAWVVCLSLP